MREKIIEGVVGASVLLLLVGLLYPIAYDSGANIKTSGTVKAYGVEVFNDFALSSVCSVIDWGLLEPNSTGAQEVFIRVLSRGNLSIFSENWVPMEAEGFIFFSTSYANETLEAETVLNCTFNIEVSGLIENITDFSFDIIVRAN